MTLIERLRTRAAIRRQIPTRKSVQENRPDRLADLLEEAATELEQRVAPAKDRDGERLDWLSVPGRRCDIWEEDSFQSFHKERKAVHYYVNGKHTITQGETLRAAIDSAIAKERA